MFGLMVLALVVASSADASMSDGNEILNDDTGNTTSTTDDNVNMTAIAQHIKDVVEAARLKAKLERKESNCGKKCHASGRNSDAGDPLFLSGKESLVPRILIACGIMIAFYLIFRFRKNILIALDCPDAARAVDRPAAPQARQGATVVDPGSFELNDAAMAAAAGSSIEMSSAPRPPAEDVDGGDGEGSAGRYA